MQIVTYGSQDLFLTGTPEITFFKVVYRRHTNFASESIRVGFDNPVAFGSESVLTVPKIGDLMHKTYLEITLPQITFKRQDTTNQNQPAFEAAKTSYEIIQAFMSINRRAFRGAFEVFEASNSNNPANMIVRIDTVFNDVTNALTIQAFKDLLLTTSLDVPFKYEEIAMQNIVDAISSDSDKFVYFKAMTVGIDKSVKTQKLFYDNVLLKQAIDEDAKNNNLKFAWVDRVGHALIDDIEVHIGGQKIDRHYGDWINIWYELTANREMEKTYKKMIGDVEILTRFDRNTKPSYLLRVPLNFWFCRHSGLSLPLVSLEYHEVTITVKFRNIEDVSYIEEGATIFVSETADSLFLDEVPEELGINIGASLLIDYIYLDSPERRRFAQASHEYLIEQVQQLEITRVNQSSIQCNLNNFVHPSKELVWVAQKEKYIENVTGYKKLRWNNYSLTDANKGNPISFTTIGFHSYDRVPRLDGNYFNYVQPYEIHSTTPSDGINVYGFSFMPEDHQPSGAANLSRLSRVTLLLEFDKSLFPVDGDHELLSIRVYTLNINILRFVSGMGGLSYTYG